MSPCSGTWARWFYKAHVRLPLITSLPRVRLVSEEPPARAEDLARLRNKASEQEAEIARLRAKAAEASDERSRLEAETREAHRREHAWSALIGRLRSEARVHEHEVASLRKRLADVEVELDDLRAMRDALTPPDLPSRPGLDLAASFLPATEQVSGDFYLVAEGPHDASLLVVGDVVGRGHAAARHAAFVRTVFATTAPFSNDPARLLGWANAVLAERAREDPEFVTVACVAVSPHERVVRWGYAGHPAALWLDTGEQLDGARTFPLGIYENLVCDTASHHFEPGTGVLLYTDGVIEARRDGEQFGPTRLSRRVHALEGQAPSRIVAALTAQVEQFADNALSDDVCIVAARSD
jgi:phosphoserine phosphatase RsbU/P